MSNGTTDYKLGQHEQALMDIQARVKSIEVKVDNLNIWRWRVVGAVSGIALGGNVAAELFLKAIK